MHRLLSTSFLMPFSLFLAIFLFAPTFQSEIKSENVQIVPARVYVYYGPPRGQHFYYGPPRHYRYHHDPYYYYYRDPYYRPRSYIHPHKRPFHNRHWRRGNVQFRFRIR